MAAGGIDEIGSEDWKEVEMRVYGGDVRMWGGSMEGGKDGV